MRHLKLVFFIFLFLGLFYAEPSYAKETVQNSDLKDMAIHTYGGGVLLQKVFNAISLILYGDSKTGLGKAFNGILRITLAIGGMSSVALAFFREKFDPLIRNFLLPAIGIVSCVLVPKTTVNIYDHLASKTSSTQVGVLYQVSNVPFVLAKIATLASSMGYQLECLFTGSSHGVNDQMYNWTGNIYAANEVFKAKKCRIASPVLETNFREFCRECVFRDLGIGLYSKDALVKTSNILQFLEKNTSNIRTVFYKDAQEEKILTCKEAMKQMNLLFKNGNAEKSAKEIAIGELGDQVHFLLDKQKNGTDVQNLIKQQIAIDVLREEIPGNLSSFSSRRAEILQKENQKTLGALGVSSIVAMRNFFEATIYMVFPIVVLISLLSFGIKSLIQWLHFILWVNIWPVFYIVINFMLSSIWDLRKQAIDPSALHGNLSLTLSTSEGLMDLYSSMESIAAISMAFIPFLSWIIIKGGVGQMVQMASSLMAPAQSAASTSAQEVTSGNYSYGNLSLDNVSGYNSSMYKQSYSGSYSQGSVMIDSGSETMTYVPDQGQMYLKQSDSYLREGVSRTEAFNSSLQNSLSRSESSTFEASTAVSSGITETGNKAVGLSEAISRHLQSGENFNTQEMSSAYKAYQYVQGASEDYATTHGIGKDAAIKEMISGSVGGGLFGVKGDFQMSSQDGVSKSEGHQASDRTFDSKTFQDQIQTIKNLSKGEVASVLGSEDAKYHEDFVQSYSNTESSVDQWRAAHSQHESLSNLSSDMKSENLSVHQNLNQRFVEFLAEKFDNDTSLVVSNAELPHSDPRKAALIDEFVSEYIPAKTTVNNSIPEYYESHKTNVKSNHITNFPENQQNIYKEGVAKIGHSFGDTQKSIDDIENRVLEDKVNRDQRIDEKKGNLSGQYNPMKNETKQITDYDNPILVQYFKESAVMHPVKTTKGISVGVWNMLFGDQNQSLQGGQNEQKP